MAKPELPHSDAFWIISEGYRDSANATYDLIRHGRNGNDYVGQAVFPCLFLYFRSIELALKACLAAHGLSEKDIVRTLSHSIKRLANRLNDIEPLEAIGLSKTDRALINTYSDEYSEKWFEYPGSAFHIHPTLEELKDLAERVCTTTRRYKR